MSFIDFDTGPLQPEITRERIEEMIEWRPRRMKLLSEEWPNPLHEPQSLDNDWNLLLPFCETFRNAFRSMCTVHNIGLRETKTGNRCFTFFPDLNEDAPEFFQVNEWLAVIGSYVALRDRLALSFAIDYDREDGNPDKPQTVVGKLRGVAKTYGGPATTEALSAADQLRDACLKTLGELTCYKSATCIVAMPPSDPEKPFDLPEYLAIGISKKLGMNDKSSYVKTIKARPGNKDLPCNEKLSNIEGTVSIEKDAFKDEIVLLIDDLYQSGVTMNYVAMLLLEAGAKKVFGLACEKTCSNDDNVSRR